MESKQRLRSGDLLAQMRLERKSTNLVHQGIIHTRDSHCGVFREIFVKFESIELRSTRNDVMYDTQCGQPLRAAPRPSNSRFVAKCRPGRILLLILLLGSPLQNPYMRTSQRPPASSNGPCPWMLPTSKWQKQRSTSGR